VSFEPGMKQWMCDGGWEWWIREYDIISRVLYARLMELRDETGSWFQGWGDGIAKWVIGVFREEDDVDCRERVTTDEERVPQGGW